MDKHTISRELCEAYYDLRIGVELSNDNAWLLWEATDADKAEVKRMSEEMRQQLDRDYRHAEPRPRREEEA